MDQPRDDRGQFVTLREFVTMLLDQRILNVEDKFAARQQALDLQAIEYARRLEDLNHAHARAQEAQNTFVTIDKYEEKMTVLDEARKIAVERLDEKLEALDVRMTNKLDDYITRYEARQREIDQAIDIGKGAAAEAQRAAEEQGRKSNRNMAVVTIVLTVIIAVSQWIGTGVTP